MSRLRLQIFNKDAKKAEDSEQGDEIDIPMSKIDDAELEAALEDLEKTLDDASDKADAAAQIQEGAKEERKKSPEPEKFVEPKKDTNVKNK